MDFSRNERASEKGRVQKGVHDDPSMALGEALSFLRSLGTVSVDLLIPGEMLAEKITHKRLRIALCKVFRVTPIYVITQK